MTLNSITWTFCQYLHFSGSYFLTMIAPAPWEATLVLKRDDARKYLGLCILFHSNSPQGTPIPAFWWLYYYPTISNRREKYSEVFLSYSADGHSGVILRIPIRATKSKTGKVGLYTHFVVNSIAASVIRITAINNLDMYVLRSNGCTRNIDRWWTVLRFAIGEVRHAWRNDTPYIIHSTRRAEALKVKNSLKTCPCRLWRQQWMQKFCDSGSQTAIATLATSSSSRF